MDSYKFKQLITKININEELRLERIRLVDHENRQIVKRKLLMQTNEEINLDILKAYIDAEEEYGDTKENLAYQALALKYKTLTTVPTTIEKTMTSAQLYASDSPLWALNYEPDVIKQMMNHLQNYPKSEEIFSIVLKEVSNGITQLNKFSTTI